MSTPKRILDVGQCGWDAQMNKQLLTQLCPCVIDQAHTKAEALSLASANSYDLILVNRLLDRDRSPGLDVLVELLAAQPHLQIMLVSGFPEAQAAALKAGALQGFGKAELNSPQTEELLKAALSSS